MQGVQQETTARRQASAELAEKTGAIGIAHATELGKHVDTMPQSAN